MNNLERYKLITSSHNLTLDGNPFVMTDGQAQIFQAIYEPEFKRVAIKAVTQYGKSDVTSLAVIHSLIDRKEKILIVSPSVKQSRIIMSYIIQHLFDDPDLQAMLDVDVSLEWLKRERSKARITLRNDSEVAILTADARTISQQAKGLMGFGATIVIVDESALIPDSMYSKILRMVGGTDGKLVQIGNPFDCEHFRSAFEQDRYHKITIDYKQALEEGRITQEFIDEARENMPTLDFQVFYECVFPNVGADDALIPYDKIQAAINREHVTGDQRAGLDIARFGRDKTVYIVKNGNYIERLEQTEHRDTMNVVGWVRTFLDKLDEDTDCNIDVVGIGAGVYDRLAEIGKYNINEVNFGSSPTDDENKEKFANLRAEVYWHLRRLFVSDEISIPDNTDLIKELRELRYGYSSEKKLKIEKKEDMKKRLGHSPDIADALSLAFFPYQSDAEIVIM